MKFEIRTGHKALDRYNDPLEGYAFVYVAEQCPEIDEISEDADGEIRVYLKAGGFVGTLLDFGIIGHSDDETSHLTLTQVNDDCFKWLPYINCRIVESRYIGTTYYELRKNGAVIARASKIHRLPYNLVDGESEVMFQRLLAQIETEYQEQRTRLEATKENLLTQQTSLVQGWEKQNGTLIRAKDLMLQALALIEFELDGTRQTIKTEGDELQRSLTQIEQSITDIKNQDYCNDKIHRLHNQLYRLLP